MKLIYSNLQKLLPGLDVPPQKLRDDLTMIGHFCNYYEETEGEIVFDLDIKVNRGDCLGYYGLARDLAVLYNLSIEAYPLIDLPQNLPPLPIRVNTDNVIRIIAAKLSGIKNSASPPWLQKFIRLHGTNPVNTLVDITNLIMFLYGIPVHAFDTNLSGEKLIWEMNPGYREFKSLDGSVLKLSEDILVVNNDRRPLSLSFWGGESCAVSPSTTETIVEIAVYNPVIVRHNSRFLKVATEASVRLEKRLDPQLIPTAFSHLIKLISDLCGASLSSSQFDYYPEKLTPPAINFDFDYPSRLSGVAIPPEFGRDILTRLGCDLSNGVIPPTIRPDISLSEDLVEEIVRFYGYQNIPVDRPLPPKEVPDITPPILYLIEKLKDDLVAQGYDEVLTWPLLNTKESSKTITTENSINDEYIYLRESLIPSLKLQLDRYRRFKLPHPRFFEIGKVYSRVDGRFVEKFALAKFDGRQFSESVIDDLDKLPVYTPQDLSTDSVELTSQILSLDANVTLEGTPDPVELIKKYSALIDPSILWSMEIVDIYESRYTFRVYYYNCDDKTAKKTHLTAFGLN